jgi:acyl carrier protein
MNSHLLSEVKNIITNTVGANVVPKPLLDDYPLLDNLLDSMLVTNLIVAIEDSFNFVFSDDELSAEDFENALTLAKLVERKVGKD